MSIVVIGMITLINFQKKVLPHSEFCSLFKVDEDEFDEDCYYDFIFEAVADAGFPEIDYDEFLDYCDSSDINETEYKKSIEIVRGKKIIGMDDFRDNLDTDEYSEHGTYDPVKKEYTWDDNDEDWDEE